MSVDVLATVYAAAKSTHYKYQRWVELGDLQQEAYLWMLEHPHIIDRHLEADSDKVGEYRILRDCAKYLDKKSRDAKAAVSGYAPEDEHWYTQGVIALVLPAVLAGSREPPRKALEGLPRAKSDPAEGNDWLALWVDVESALRKLEPDDVHLLVDRHHEELTYDAIAEQWGWASTDTAHKAVRRAEEKLIGHLGGRKPQGCPESGCDHYEHDERLRARSGGERW